jgi:hypothetical protein
MFAFFIEPLVGVGPIKFGQTRSDVRAVMSDLGQPQARLRSAKTDCFFGSALQVSYDQDERVEFVESARSEAFQFLFHGEALHEMPAEDAVRFVSGFAAYYSGRAAKGYSYIFPALQLALWRGVLPSSDPEERRGRFFDSVAVGKDGYFDQMLKGSRQRRKT